MKRNFLSLLLLPILLVSCSIFNEDKKSDNNKTENTQEQEEEIPKIDYYPLVLDGPTTICLNYCATFDRIKRMTFCTTGCLFY